MRCENPRCNVANRHLAVVSLPGQGVLRLCSACERYARYSRKLRFAGEERAVGGGETTRMETRECVKAIEKTDMEMKPSNIEVGEPDKTNTQGGDSRLIEIGEKMTREKQEISEESHKADYYQHNHAKTLICENPNCQMKCTRLTGSFLPQQKLVSLCNTCYSYHRQHGILRPVILVAKSRLRMRLKSGERQRCENPHCGQFGSKFHVTQCEEGEPVALCGECHSYWKRYQRLTTFTNNLYISSERSDSDDEDDGEESDEEEVESEAQDVVEKGVDFKEKQRREEVGVKKLDLEKREGVKNPQLSPPTALIASKWNHLPLLASRPKPDPLLKIACLSNNENGQLCLCYEWEKEALLRQLNGQHGANYRG